MTTRVVVQSNTEAIDWNAAILAGIVGMLAFIALQMAFAWLLKAESPWTPLHMIGATILGAGTLAPAGMRLQTGPPRPGTKSGSFKYRLWINDQLVGRGEVLLRE